MSYLTQVIADGATVYWPLHDAAGSSTVVDVTSGNHPGTVTSHTLGAAYLGTTVPVGTGTNAVQGDGVTGHGIAGSQVIPTNAFSIEIWARPISTTPNYGESSNGTYGTSGAKWVVYPDHHANDHGLGIAVGTNAVEVWAHGNAFLPCISRYATTITDWVHIVITLASNASTPLTYVNGTLVKTGSFTPGSLSSTYGASTIGTGPYGGYDGQYAAFAQYPSVLTVSQIQNHYNLGLQNLFTSVLASGALGSRSYGGGANHSAPNLKSLDLASVGQTTVTMGLSVARAEGDIVVAPSLPTASDIDLYAKTGPNSGAFTSTGRTNITMGLGARQRVTMTANGVTTPTFFLGRRFNAGTLTSTGITAISRNILQVILANNYFTIYASKPPYLTTDVLLATRVGPSQNAPLTGSPHGTTTVTGDLSRSSFQTSNISGSTTVTGRVNLNEAMTGAVQGITSVHAAMTRTIPTLAGTGITCSTTVTGNLSRYILRGNTITCSTTVAGDLLRTVALRAAIVGRTTVTARAVLALRLTGSFVVGSTSLTSNLTYKRDLGTGTVTCSTTVDGALNRSVLRGTTITGRTTFGTVTLYLASSFGGLCAGSTGVFISPTGFQRIAKPLEDADVGDIVCGTTVRARLFNYGPDFYPVNITSSVYIVATLRLRLPAFATIAGRTTVHGNVTGLQTATGSIHGSTVVRGKAKAGFGGEALGYTYLDASLAVAFLLTAVRVNAIHGSTVVTAAKPINGTSGRAWGGTRFTRNGLYGQPDYLVFSPTGVQGYYASSNKTYDISSAYFQFVPGVGNVYVGNFPSLLINQAIKPVVITGRTQFKTLVVPSRAYAHNQKGLPPFYGPLGFVSLSSVPKGDLGLGDFIDGSTVVGGNALALRHRTLTLLGAAGLEVTGRIVFVGDAARGTGQRVVSTGTQAKKEQAERGPQKQLAYFV